MISVAFGTKNLLVCEVGYRDLRGSEVDRACLEVARTLGQEKVRKAQPDPGGGQR